MPAAAAPEQIALPPARDRDCGARECAAIERTKMTTTATAFRSAVRREWREIARLLLQSCAAGVFASLVLALAVFIAATQAKAVPLRDEEHPLASFERAVEKGQPAWWSSRPSPTRTEIAARALGAGEAASFAAGAVAVASGLVLLVRRRRVAAVRNVEPAEPLSALEHRVRASRSVC